MEYGAIDKCQVCEGPNLKSVLFIGYLPPVNRMRDLAATLDEEVWFPAELFYCPQCHLVQLGYAGDPNVIFPPDYPYTSGTTKILHENFAELYRECSSIIDLKPDDLIIDIGSNDGTLLKNFADNLRVQGIEPTNAAKLAIEAGIPTIQMFFSREAADKALAQAGTPKIVTATNVFAHIHNIHDILNNIERLTGGDGVFINESHYWPSLNETLQYDTIYHEHLRYYSLTSVKYLLESHGFTIFHAKKIPTHGGSIRVYASKSDQYEMRPTVGEILTEEEKAGVKGDGWIDSFRDRVTKSKLELYELLSGFKKNGSKIYGIGAPSRASTLVNYVGLDDGIIDYVLEVSTSKKLNKYLPGTKIPVIDEKILYTDQPEYALMLSWHIADDLCPILKNKGFKGDFIIPLPTPHVVTNSSVKI